MKGKIYLVNRKNRSAVSLAKKLVKAAGKGKVLL